MRPHRGVTVLVLGILGLVTCPFLGIAAWFMGDTDLEEMRAGRMDASGRDMTNAGRICGMVASAIFAVWAIVFCLFFLGAFFRSK